MNTKILKTSIIIIIIIALAYYILTMPMSNNSHKIDPLSNNTITVSSSKPVVQITQPQLIPSASASPTTTQATSKQPTITEELKKVLPPTIIPPKSQNMPPSSDDKNNTNSSLINKSIPSTVANKPAPIESSPALDSGLEISVYDNGSESSTLSMAIINGDLVGLTKLISSTSKKNLFHDYIMMNSEGKSDSFNLLHILLLNMPDKNSDNIMRLLLDTGFTLFDRSKNGISVADIFEDIGQHAAANKIREIEISKSKSNTPPKAQPITPRIDPVLEAFNKDKTELLNKLQSEADVYIKSISGRIKTMSDSDIMFEYHRSLKHNQPLVLQYLLENGLAVDALDEKGNNPLILAIANENKEFVMKLLSNGASPNLKANDISPLALAIDRTNPSVLISLILAGADIEEKNKDGEKLIDNLLVNHTHPLSKPLMSFIFSNSEN